MLITYVLPASLSTSVIWSGLCRETWHDFTQVTISVTLAKRQKLPDCDLCSCGENQTMSRIDNFCPLTKLDGKLSQLRLADDAAIAWQTDHGT